MHGTATEAGETTKDPVCGMTVRTGATARSAVHDGHTYYFCSEGCRTRFAADPKRYVTPTAPPRAETARAGRTSTCPMHPEVRQVGPGSCPICGMALEPLEVSATEDADPELRDIGPSRADQLMQPQQVPAHIERYDRHRQREPDPEPPRHVEQFGIGVALRLRHFGFERHAADRTGARTLLPNLRMHGAGEDRSHRHRCGRLACRRIEIFRGIGGKLRAATTGAEEVELAAMAVAVRRRLRIHGHAADRIERAVAGRRFVFGRRSHLCHLAINTLGGYIAVMQTQAKASVRKRLQRIEGQVRGLARMVEQDRYCIDVVTQISAVRAALRAVEDEILRDHVDHCVEHAIAGGNKAEQRRKVAELMDVLGRSAR